MPMEILKYFNEMGVNGVGNGFDETDSFIRKLEQLGKNIDLIYPIHFRFHFLRYS